MNATKGETRSLRERKPVNYNVDAMELQQYNADESQRAPAKNKKRPKTVAVLGSEDDAFSEPTEAESGSSAESEVDSDDGVIVPAKTKLPKSTPERRQPTRRAAAAVKNMKEDSDSEGEEEEPLRTFSRKISRSASARARRGTSIRSQSYNSNCNSEEDSEGEEADNVKDSLEEKEQPKRRTRVSTHAQRKISNRDSIKSGPDHPLDEEEEEIEPEPEPAKRKNPAKANYTSITKVLDSREGTGKEEFFVMFAGKSYRKAAWVAGAPLRKHERGRRMIQAFFNRQRDPELVNGILSEWLRVDRVISTRRINKATHYLVKWCGLPYKEATWEAEEDLIEDQEQIKKFHQREAARHDTSAKKQNDKDVVPTFLNGRSLRNYQVESLKWMVSNLKHRRHCILGDEMGLGKTAQSIAVLEYQRQILGIRGPFLVIAPLTTLGHWFREIETWTGMNVVQYTGSKEDRDLIKEYEFAFSTSKRSKEVKFDVLLTSYEMLLKDKTTFRQFGDQGKLPKLQAVIIDEAHRLKGLKSSTREVVDSLSLKWLLLLTGTPVQNNMRELFGILNLLDHEKWGDEDEFYDKYGGRSDSDPPTVDQVQALQADLRPVLLRRMKEDVEDLPEKEEVIVWVELSRQQRFYYKALYSQQIGTLLGGGSHKNLPNLRNLAMELRKVCCHPYLCNGLEDDIADRHREMGASGDTELGRMINASGKMVLLHKLLPKLKVEGRKVLIFSQFKIMLNVIEDSLTLCNYPFERIDGSVAGRDRQQAIDRFTKGGEETFVFLLSTKAGGQGITLTAADTVIIYDSDWNPQNDLQAMARCHRIGQSKDVTVYRLICKDTYEEQLFNIASRKYGLDEAILGNINEENPEQNSAHIANLLKNGAHSLIAREETKAKEGEEFAEADITEILAQRTEKRQIGSRAGNTFSTAQFAAEAVEVDANGNERDYWTTLMPDDVAAFEAKRAAGPPPLGPRKRKRVNYADSPAKARKGLDADLPNARSQHDEALASVGHEDSCSESGEEFTGEQRRKSGALAGGKRHRASGAEWSQAQVKRLETCLIQYGPNHFHDIRGEISLYDKSLEEVKEVSDVIIKLLIAASRLAKSKEKAKIELAKAEKVIANLEDTAMACNTHTVYQAIKQDVENAEKRFKTPGSQELIPDDLIMPPAAEQAIKALVQTYHVSGPKAWTLVKQRVALANFLSSLADGNAADLAYLRNMRHFRAGSKMLPDWWSTEQDLALLMGSFIFGFRPAIARWAIECMFRDPFSPLHHKLGGAGAHITAMMDHESVLDNVDGPDYPDVLDRLSDIDRPPLDCEKLICPADDNEYRKLIDMLVSRLKALLKEVQDRDSQRKSIERSKGNAKPAPLEAIEDSSDPDSGNKSKLPLNKPSARGTIPLQAANPVAPAAASSQPTGEAAAANKLSVHDGGVKKVSSSNQPPGPRGFRRQISPALQVDAAKSGPLPAAADRGGLAVPKKENAPSVANVALIKPAPVIDLTGMTPEPLSTEDKPKAKAGSSSQAAKKAKASKMKQATLFGFKTKP